MEYQLISSPWIKKITPIALSVTASVGVVSTAILAVKATPDALERKAEAEKEKGESLTTWEAFKAMLPSYIPAIATGTLTIGSIAGAAILNDRQQSKLAGIITGSNQIINQASKKFNLLREDVRKRNPEILEVFDKKCLDDEWNRYIKERQNKRAWCWPRSLPIEESEEYGQIRMFGIEYGNGLRDENGHEYIFFEATPGDVITAFYNLNGLARQDGTKKVNDLFHLMNLPKTQLGDALVWDPCVMWEEWESDFIHFTTEDIPMEDDAPQPLVCTLIHYTIPPLAEGYAEGIGIPDCCFPVE